jgi:1,4-dihydroxy-2-naphthoate octaprenyltransferase
VSAASATLRTGEAKLRPEIIVPVIMGCAMLWWVGRGLDWTKRLVAVAVTLVVIVLVVLFERSGWRP